MQLCFDESCIPYWANRYNTEQLSQRRELEGSLIAMEHRVQQEGHFTMETLRKIVIWQRATWSLQESYLGQYSDNDIIDITSEAFTETDIDRSLLILAGLNGIGSTIGSAILHLYHKERCPIYSTPALQSVCERKGQDVVNANWQPYVEYCKELADRNKVSMRTLDKALWRHSATYTP